MPIKTNNYKNAQNEQKPRAFAIKSSHKKTESDNK